MTVLQRLYHLLRAQVQSGRRAEKWEIPPPEAEAGPVPPGRSVDARLAGYYANLEIPYGSDLETARRAWKRLMKKYHPDRHSRDPEKQRLADELAAQLTGAFQEIEKALARQEKG